MFSYFITFNNINLGKFLIKKINDLLQDQCMVGLITEPGNTEEWKKLLGDVTHLCGSDKFIVVAEACDAGYENYSIQWKHVNHIDSDRGMHKRLIMHIFLHLARDSQIG